MGRDLWGTDNPERVASEGEAPSDCRRPERDEDADYEAKRDEEIMAEFNEGAEVHAAEWDALQNDLQKAGLYEGGLIDDCKSIMELGEQLKAKMAEPEPEDIFVRARRLNAEAALRGDGKIEARESIFGHGGGYYENLR
jgi:hypothetical protein